MFLDLALLSFCAHFVSLSLYQGYFFVGWMFEATFDANIVLTKINGFHMMQELKNSDVNDLNFVVCLNFFLQLLTKVISNLIFFTRI